MNCRFYLLNLFDNLLFLLEKIDKVYLIFLNSSRLFDKTTNGKCYSQTRKGVISWDDVKKLIEEEVTRTMLMGKSKVKGDASQVTL